MLLIKKHLNQMQAAANLKIYANPKIRFVKRFPLEPARQKSANFDFIQQPNCGIVLPAISNRTKEL